MTDTTDYVNDALDRPVKQTETHSSTTTTIKFNYVGASNALSSETHTGGTNTTRTYSYDAFGQRLTLSDGTDRYSYLYDPHGSISLLIDQANAVKASYGYSGYGSANSSLTRTAGGFNPNANAYRYSGKRFDTGSNTYDMGARRYSPSTGRFLQQDIYYGAFADLGLATDPFTQNRYQFTGANPINFVEWDGHRACGDAEEGCGEFSELPPPEPELCEDGFPPPCIAVDPNAPAMTEAELEALFEALYGGRDGQFGQSGSPIGSNLALRYGTLISLGFDVQKFLFGEIRYFANGEPYARGVHWLALNGPIALLQELAGIDVLGEMDTDEPYRVAIRIRGFLRPANSMFPAGWSLERVLDEINYAFRNAEAPGGGGLLERVPTGNGGFRLEGCTPSGILVYGFVPPASARYGGGRLDTVYPVVGSDRCRKN